MNKIEEYLNLYYINSNMDVVISARVPEEALSILKKRQLNVSEIVRTSIIEAAEREKLEESRKALLEMSKIMKKIDKHEFVRSIREDRDEAH